MTDPAAAARLDALDDFVNGVAYLPPGFPVTGWRDRVRERLGPDAVIPLRGDTPTDETGTPPGSGPDWASLDDDEVRWLLEYGESMQTED